MEEGAGEGGDDAAAGFRAYTTTLLPITGVSTRSASRVSVCHGLVPAMSHTSAWWYARTSGLSSLVGPTAHLSHQYGAWMPWAWCAPCGSSPTACSLARSSGCV